MAGRIHCSKETAELLRKSCKEAWLEKRTDNLARGVNGSISSYWVNVRGDRAGSTTMGSTSAVEDLEVTNTYGTRLPGLTDKENRQVDWIVETLLCLLRQVVARRNALMSSKKDKTAPLKKNTDHGDIMIKTKRTPISEVLEIIALPKFDAKAAKNQEDPDKVEIPPVVIAQLHHYVSMIATMYNQNPFHNL